MGILGGAGEDRAGSDGDEAGGSAAAYGGRGSRSDRGKAAEVVRGGGSQHGWQAQGWQA